MCLIRLYLITGESDLIKSSEKREINTKLRWFQIWSIVDR